MKYRKAIEYLYGLQQHGMKFGLDNIRRLLLLLGNPHTAFRSVHVAGTNGKGSTSAMTASIIRASGMKTGLFTSPHLVNFTERIRINGEEIGEQDVAELADEVRETAGREDDFSPTFFEVVTAMAFLYFKRSRVDWAVVEVGLGGRLDATNVIVPEVSVITGIGLDHCEFLGRTLREIAAEKAGIIKPGVPVVTAVQAPEAGEVISLRAAGQGCPLFTHGTDFSSDLTAETPGGIGLDYRGTRQYRGLRVPLSGRHQAVNAGLAIKTAEVIQERYPGMGLDIPAGLAAVEWPGRLEMLQDDPPILIDGAHNPQAAQALSSYLREVVLKGYRRILLVAGIMGDKDIKGIMAPLLPCASEIVFTAPAYGRAASPEMLSSLAASLGYRSSTAPTVADAVRAAEKLLLPGDIIVVTGSFYTIGEAKELLRGKGVLSRLRE